MKVLYTVAFVLLLASSTSAQSLTVPTFVFGATAVGDWTSTAYCTTSGKCREANPLFGWAQPKFGTTGVLVVGGATDIAMALAIRHLGVRHPKIAAFALYVSAAARVGIAVRNAKIGYMLRQQPAPCPSGTFCRQ